ncbi:hypothetical protein J6590_037357, partial [Homalodisca vitripennis]
HACQAVEHPDWSPAVYTAGAACAPSDRVLFVLSCHIRLCSVEPRVASVNHPNQFYGYNVSPPVARSADSRG